MDVQAFSADEIITVQPSSSAVGSIMTCVIPHQKLQLGCQNILQGKTRQVYT